MYCGKCGATIAEGAERCSACGEPVTSSGDPASSPTSGSARSAQLRVAYAGFWLRALACIVDLTILSLAMAPATFKLLATNVGAQASPRDILAFYMGGTQQATAIMLLVQLVLWLYYASMESSRWQATLGKRLFGLYVTDLGGKQITFARASGRHFGKLVSQFVLFLGYVMAGFTARKQALHDMLAGCLVLRKI